MNVDYKYFDRFYKRPRRLRKARRQVRILYLSSKEAREASRGKGSREEREAERKGKQRKRKQRKGK